MGRRVESLLDTPRIVPPEIYRAAKSEAVQSLKSFGSTNHPVVTELTDVIVQALTGLGFTKFLFVNAPEDLPVWQGNFPPYNFRFPSLEEAFSVAQTVASECQSVLYDSGRRGEVATQHAARAVVVSLYASGCLLVDFGKDWARNN